MADESIGNFLLRRLYKAGIWHIFAVHGDYNLEFIQQLEERGDLTCIGNCNELNGFDAAPTVTPEFAPCRARGYKWRAEL